MNTVSADQLKIEELRLRYLEMISRPEVFPTRANWQFISRNKLRGLGHALFGKYLAALTVDEVDRDELHDIALEEFPEYLKSIDREEALSVVYYGITHAPAEMDALIHDCRLFDADYILNLLDNGDLQLAVDLIDSYQPEYTAENLESMKMLLERLQNLPDLGHIELRQGIFGESEKYICPNGHVNPSNIDFCTHPDCGLDARGLTKSQEKAIDDFACRTKALNNLLTDDD